MFADRAWRSQRHQRLPVCNRGQPSTIQTHPQRRQGGSWINAINGGRDWCLSALPRPPCGTSANFLLGTSFPYGRQERTGALGIEAFSRTRSRALPRPDISAPATLRRCGGHKLFNKSPGQAAIARRPILAPCRAPNNYNMKRNPAAARALRLGDRPDGGTDHISAAEGRRGRPLERCCNEPKVT